jgi:hypothetical protein
MWLSTFAPFPAGCPGTNGPMQEREPGEFRSQLGLRLDLSQTIY